MTLNVTISIRMWCYAILITVISIAANASAQTTPTPVAAPSPQPSPTPTLERQFFKNILRDQRAIFTSPLHLQKEDSFYLIPLGAATAALIATDQRTSHAIYGLNRTSLNMSRDISYIGAGASEGGIAGAFYLIGRATHNKRARETGLLAGEALIDGGIVSTAIKEVTQRPRPLIDGGHGRFFTGGNDFASGHAISTWTVMTVVAHEYQDKPFIKYGAYSVAVAVSVSRYTGHKHFLSDVLVGSAIGYGIGHYVYKTHHDKTSDEQTSSSSSPEKSKLIPMIAPRYNPRERSYGIRLAWIF